MSHQGENAVEKANRVISALIELKEKVSKRKSKVNAHLNTGLKSMEARLNINMIPWGLKVNIVPDSCVISIDRRLIPKRI